MEGVLTGAGTSSLIVHGVTISVDTAGLGHPLLLTIVGLNFMMPSTVTPITLMPAPDYSFQPGSGITCTWVFSVGLDGSVDYAGDCDGFLAGRGTSTLAVRGVQISVDTTALSHWVIPLEAVAISWFEPGVNTWRAAPASGYRFLVTSGVVATISFDILRDGTVTVPALFAGYAEATGSLLTLHGHSVTFDAGDISTDIYILMWGPFPVLHRRSTLAATILPAGNFQMVVGSGEVADITFAIKDDGTFDYPSAQDLSTTGRDTANVTFHGFPVLVDARLADSALLALVNSAVSAQSPLFLFASLLPCSMYVLQSANGVFATAFTVNLDGSLSVPAAAAGRMVVSTIPRLQLVGATPI